MLEAGPCGANEVVRLLRVWAAWAGHLCCCGLAFLHTAFLHPSPPPHTQALPLSRAKCEHELATQPALTFHPLGRMAIFVPWDIAEWSLCYPNSCQPSPVVLLWEEAADSPSLLKSRAQGEKENGRAGKEPGGPESLPGLGGWKAALMKALLPAGKGRAGAGSERL